MTLNIGTPLYVSTTNYIYEDYKWLPFHTSKYIFFSAFSFLFYEYWVIYSISQCLCECRHRLLFLFSFPNNIINVFFSRESLANLFLLLLFTNRLMCIYASTWFNLRYIPSDLRICICIFFYQNTQSERCKQWKLCLWLNHENKKKMHCQLANQSASHPVSH